MHILSLLGCIQVIAHGLPSEKFTPAEYEQAAAAQKKTFVIPIGSSETLSPHCTVKIGANEQEFRLLLCTGSLTTWVSDARVQIPGWNSRNQFDPRKSSTVRPVPSTFRQVYGANTVLGNTYMDQMNVADIKLEEVKFGLVYAITSPQSISPNVDGYLGLAPGHPEDGIEYSFMNILAIHGVISCRKFGFLFTKQPLASGLFVLGDEVEKRLRGPIQYIASTSALAWKLELDAISVGGKQFQIDAKEVLLDTGYKSVVLPTNLANAINALLMKIDERGTSFDCNASKVLPEGTFRFGKVQLVLTRSQYMTTFNNSQCMRIFLGADPIAYASIILGMSFVQQFDTVFDLDNMQVGFAVPEF